MRYRHRTTLAYVINVKLSENMLRHEFNKFYVVRNRGCNRVGMNQSVNQSENQSIIPGESIEITDSTPDPRIGIRIREIYWGIESWMESEVNDASQARSSDRARTKTPKAAELENPDLQDKNNEHTTDDNIEVETNIPRAPRIKRTRPTISATIGKGHFTGKGKDVTTKETLASILEALEELKDNNTDLKAAVGELTTKLAHVKARLAETKQQLTYAIETISTLSTTWSDIRTEGSSPRSYASVLARSINPSSSASQPTSGNTNDDSSRDSGPPGVTIDTRRVRDVANIA